MSKMQRFTGPGIDVWSPCRTVTFRGKPWPISEHMLRWLSSPKGRIRRNNDFHANGVFLDRRQTRAVRRRLGRLYRSWLVDEADIDHGKFLA